MSVIVCLLSCVGSLKVVEVDKLAQITIQELKLTSLALVITFGSRAIPSWRITTVSNSRRCSIQELCMPLTSGSTWSINSWSSSKDSSAIAQPSIWETQVQWLTKAWLETLSTRFRSSTTTPDDAPHLLSRTRPSWDVIARTTTGIIRLAEKVQLQLFFHKRECWMSFCKLQARQTPRRTTMFMQRTPCKEWTITPKTSAKASFLQDSYLLRGSLKAAKRYPRALVRQANLLRFKRLNLMQNESWENWMRSRKCSVKSLNEKSA